MKEVYVGLQVEGKMEPVGVIRFDTDRKVGVFAYLPTYSGPPLDPVNLAYDSDDSGSSLRIGKRVFGVDPIACPGLIHRVFQDALPGGWGMQVLRSEYPELRGMLDCDLLHWFGSRTSGALSFFIRNPEDEKPVNGVQALTEVRRRSEEFQRTQAAMELFGMRNPAVASHGGVMPKASYVDEFGTHWLAKFDPVGQGTQYTLLEQLACDAAAACGIDVPTTKIVQAADGGGEIFLSMRFDRQAEMRCHRISAFALMSTSTVRDTGEGDYRMMFDALKKICPEAAWVSEATELLRRMAFNIGLNVLDDHLRNHELLLDSRDGQWSLAPAFDLVPNSSSSPHGCGLFGVPRATLDPQGYREFWNRVADAIGLTRVYVDDIVTETREKILAHWPDAVADSRLNEFNKINAMLAMEIGCGVSDQRERAQERWPRSRSKS